MQNISVSEVERTHAAVRFLCPVQSVEQFLSLTATLGGVLLLMSGALHLWAPSVPLLVVLLPAALCGFVPVYSVLPARITLHTSGLAGTHFLRAVEEHVHRLGYRQPVPAPNGRRYRTGGPRWQRWIENEISVTCVDTSIEVTGPVFALRALKARLERAA